jgi:hypothetical protein
MTRWIQKVCGEIQTNDPIHCRCAALATFLSKLAVALAVGIVFVVFVVAD